MTVWIYNLVHGANRTRQVAYILKYNFTTVMFYVFFN